MGSIVDGFKDLGNWLNPTQFDRTRYQAVGKADLDTTTATAVAHILNAEQSEKFFSLGQDDAVLINDSRIMPMRAQQQDINQITVNGLLGTIGTPGEGTAVPAASRAAPSFSRAQLAAEEFLFQGQVTKDWLEDNIEKEGGWDTVQREFSAGMLWGLENAAWDGNTAVANPAGWGTALGTTIDGWNVQATTNVYDHAGALPSRALFHEMLLQLPTRYRKRNWKDSFVFYVHPDVDEYMRYVLETRDTVGGDGFLLRDDVLKYHGHTIKTAACISTTTTGTGAASGAGAATTTVLLCEPKNKVVGYHRNINVFKHFSTDGRINYVTYSVRFDVAYQNEQAVVKAINVLSP